MPGKRFEDPELEPSSTPGRPPAGNVATDSWKPEGRESELGD